jgi:hypothetical protein
VYAPSATLSDKNMLNVFFAGYHTPKPKNGLGDYRTIGRITLRSNQRIVDLSTNVRGDGEDYASTSAGHCACADGAHRRMGYGW